MKLVFVNILKLVGNRHRASFTDDTDDVQGIDSNKQGMPKRRVHVVRGIRIIKVERLCDDQKISQPQDVFDGQRRKTDEVP